jgi:hypothetical protein
MAVMVWTETSVWVLTVVAETVTVELVVKVSVSVVLVVVLIVVLVKASAVVAVVVEDTSVITSVLAIEVLVWITTLVFVTGVTAREQAEVMMLPGYLLKTDGRLRARF